ncbi:hypothetical protein BDM02DRAFT_3153386 [Thelephora ganbajun]|uniref:Uncharacterized protein n=1 Tax=Thelephora ganbajun TaxID=370292 RepID=A0ACB6ZUV2_THEGA|nr:hypothetical protein BDM02DRAFT_3153386 [Thelephora ganbajun]
MSQHTSSATIKQTTRASEEQLNFNDPHPPRENALDAFSEVVTTIKQEMIKSRRHWDAHEPRMWSRAAHLSDKELTSFHLHKDIVLVSSAATAYGTIILGKIRIPGIDDDQGEGFVHVRIHDPPNRGIEDIIFHSIFTDEGNRDKDGRPTTWRAVQTAGTPLTFFNE